MVAVVLYTLAGFFALPRWVEATLVETLAEATGYRASVGRVRTNPYALTLDIEALSLDDPEGPTWMAFDRLHANLQVSGLFRRAWTFREIRLDGPRYRVERFDSGETRLGRVLASRPAPPVAAEPTGFSLPRLLIQTLAVNGGRVAVRDAVPAEPVELDFGPIDVQVSDLSTLEAEDGDKRVTVQLPGGAVARWSGNADLAPPGLSGGFALDGADLSPLLPYLQPQFAIDDFAAALSVSFAYSVSWPLDGELELELDQLEASLSGLAIGALGAAEPVLALGEVRVEDGTVRIPDRTATFPLLQVTGLAAQAWLESDGTLSLTRLLRTRAETDPRAAAVAPSPDAAAGRDWQVSVTRVELADGRVAFEDRGMQPPAEATLSGVTVALGPVGNVGDEPVPVSIAANLDQGGSLALDATVTAPPDPAVTGHLELAGIPLAVGQPYVGQQTALRIEDGHLDAGIEVALGADGALSLNGALSVANLQTVDSRDGEPVLGWKTLSIDRFEADPVQHSLRISEVELTAPSARLLIREDLTTNLTGLLVPPAEAAAGDAPDTEPPAAAAGGSTDEGTAGQPAGWSVRIARIGVEEASLDFADRSLPLPFGTHVQHLGGRITALDTASSEPGDIEFEGRVDDYGLARASGRMVAVDPLQDTDIRVEFRNLRMSDLSPYTVGFAGREIAEGKLDLDLNYHIVSSQLKASNDIVMSDLVLGDRVEHPGAASLPLGLAVALLKDANGVIDIEIPIEGDVDDPEFRIGGVIWQAFVGLITKIVAAPFKLLGGLVGGGAADLGQFEFLAGRSDLTPPALEKLGQLRAALEQRPELAVVIAGTYAPGVDTPALRYRNLRVAVIERLGDAAALGPGRDAMLDEAVRDILEGLHQERFPELDPESLRAPHRAPPPDDPEGEPVFDDLAYAADLRDRLLEAEAVSQADLEALAGDRAAAIRDALLAGGALDETRVRLEAPEEGKSEDGEWVVLELDASVD